MILLHYQERQFQQQTQTNHWQPIYKLPKNADRLVIEYRKWFEKYCQGKLHWGKSYGTSLIPPTNADGC